jgi:hypothetical protein
MPALNPITTRQTLEPVPQEVHFIR